MSKVKGNGTKDSPWALKTPPGTSDYEAYRDAEADPPALVVQVGKTQLRYHLRSIDDLHAMLLKHGDWMLLGSADEQKPVADGTVESWGRASRAPGGYRFRTNRSLSSRAVSEYSTFGASVLPTVRRGAPRRWHTRR
jgi:hypothetical protein